MRGNINLRRRAWTLIEVMIIFVILGILAAIVIPQFTVDPIVEIRTTNGGDAQIHTRDLILIEMSRKDPDHVEVVKPKPLEGTFLIKGFRKDSNGQYETLLMDNHGKDIWLSASERRQLPNRAGVWIIRRDSVSYDGRRQDFDQEVLENSKIPDTNTPPAKK